MTMNNQEVAKAIRNLAEDLCVEILAEATAEDYEEALDSQVEHLTHAVAILEHLGAEVPFLVKELLSRASDHRSKN